MERRTAKKVADTFNSPWLGITTIISMERLDHETEDL